MSKKHELTGKVHIISDTQSFPSGFQKREFVITTSDDKYPQTIKMEVVKDDCEKLDGFRPGDDITAHFNIRGNEYNGKYYVNLQAWKVEGEPSGKSSGQTTQATKTTPAPNPTADHLDEDDDSDITF
jgi:single-strand DNA-binding protein